MQVYLIQHQEHEGRVLSAFNTPKQADDECVEMNRKWIEEKRKFLILSGYPQTKQPIG